MPKSVNRGVRYRRALLPGPRKQRPLKSRCDGCETGASAAAQLAGKGRENFVAAVSRHGIAIGDCYSNDGALECAVTGVASRQGQSQRRASQKKAGGRYKFQS